MLLFCLLTPIYWKTKHNLHQTLLQSKTGLIFVPNEVKVVDKSHLEKHCISAKWQKGIDKIAKDFDLNAEQERTYHIVANHSYNPNAKQLKMNFAGMAGWKEAQLGNQH